MSRKHCGKRKRLEEQHGNQSEASGSTAGVQPDDNLSGCRQLVGEWKREWAANNPALPLPEDIQAKVDEWTRLVLQPCSPVVASILAVDIQKEVQSYCASLSLSVQLVHSPGKAVPLLHKARNKRKLLDEPKFLDFDVQGYVDDIRRTHPGLMSSRVKLDSNSLAKNNMERMISCEQDLMPFFRSEIAPKIALTIQHRRPEALVELIEGRPTDHADLFLKVTSPNANDETVTSVAIEFKRPYGDNFVPSTPETLGEWPDWMKLTNMPSASFAKHAIPQILHYMVDGYSRAPPIVHKSIIGNIGILSTFNTTWIIVAMPDSQSRVDDIGSLTELPAAITYNPKERGRLRVYVSQPFYADCKKLYIAFVYAYIIEHIIDCMTRSTSRFKIVPED